VIAANLAYEDQISESQKLFVSNTTTKTYAGVMREVNYASTEEGDPNGGSTAVEFYWDRMTGIITGMSLVKTYESNFTAIASIIMKMTETNIWQPDAGVGGMEWVVAAGIIIIPIILVAFMVVRKPRKRMRTRHKRMPKERSSLPRSFRNRNILN
jgi:hypothetical protein